MNLHLSKLPNIKCNLIMVCLLVWSIAAICAIGNSNADEGTGSSSSKDQQNTKQDHQQTTGNQQQSKSQTGGQSNNPNGQGIEKSYDDGPAYPMKRSNRTARSFYPTLQNYLEARASSFDAIPGERKADLAKVADYIRQRLSKSEPAKLTFICTHNSRRSHFSQIWAQVAADYYGLSGVETYSGGTEATAFNPRAVAAMQRCGLRIVADDPGAANPRYSVYTSDSSVPQICFSKIHDAPPNPTKEYCAVMTCSQADEACPLVMGCDLRMPIRYEDPKVADDTELETQRYDERSEQICTELLYIMSLV